jgi:hypothetical protein
VAGPEVAEAVVVVVAVAVVSKLLSSFFLSESTDRRFMSLRNSVLLFFYLHDHGEHSSVVTPGLFPTWEGDRKSNALFFLLSLRFPWLIWATFFLTWTSVATGEACGDEVSTRSLRLGIMYADGQWSKDASFTGPRSSLQSMGSVSHKIIMLHEKLNISKRATSSYQHQCMPVNH